jgi:hypothetical protein
MLYRKFWEAGYRVFPLYGIDKKGRCECGDPNCDPKARFKHPRMSNWQHTPVWDDEQIANFEEAGWFKTGYGVLCSGLLIIDVDARNGGVESFQRLVSDYPEINADTFEVTTGSGGGSKHIYFRLSEPVALIQSHKDYPGVDFKSSGYVVGPGSLHVSGDTYDEDGYVDEIVEAPSALIDLLRKPERHRADYNGTPLDVSHSDISEMLRAIPNASLDYETWVRVGMAVHHATDGTGYGLWEEWSASCPDKHNAAQMPNKWHSFGRSANPVTIGTLIHHAQEHGWKMPLHMQDGMGELPEISMAEPAPKDGLPFSIDSVDLTQPPGFVGEVARWIETQSRRPRKHLAVAAALTAVGNIGGLRYTDDKDGVTTNLFTFCVAGSRTGKESIQQAVFALHKAAGIMPASHGSIKSEQEVTRNLLRHQSAMYIVDEIGIFLQKVKNAQTRGGASYLDGVIGILMNIYSKANGWALLGGDTKEDLRGMLLKELSQFTKRANDGDTKVEPRIEEINRALDNVDKGLDRPFLSLLGFTTPETFSHLVDFDSATNGFIGRAMLFQEHDTAPRSKRGFTKALMDDRIEMTAKSLFYDGEYDSGAMRVENYRERSVVPSDAKAADMLDACLDWLEDKASDQRGEKGLEALWLGAYELVSKVSLVLAVAEGVRTVEHVRWAFAAVKRDVETKIRLVVGNDDVKHAPVDAMRARIEVLCVEETSFGIIKNKLGRVFREDDMLKVLSSMVAAGSLLEARSQHPKKKTEIVKYRLP